MSVSADVSVLVPAGGTHARARRYARAAPNRPVIRLVSFAALGLYGTLRWATLLSPAPQWRLLGLLAVALVLAGAGSWLATRSRAALVLLALLAALALFPLSGIPLSWVRHVRIAVTANGIGEGLSALPRALVPYTGINEWLRLVTVMGAGVLLLDGAMMLAFAPRAASDLRRGATALPLVALAVVPSTLSRPPLAYAHGLVLFLLVAAFIWGERLRRDDLVVAGSLAALAAAAAMIAAPGLDQHKPWLNYQALAGNLAPAHPESFDWTQRYGPLHWPRTGHEVLDVQAAHPDYWKAENLDLFDGKGWAAASFQAPDPQYTVPATNLPQWTQIVHVTLRAMRTTDVIAAGVAQQPSHIVPTVVAGVSNGTWTVPAGLGPGDSYAVRAYDPQPSPHQLRSAGTNYPGVLLPAYLSLLVPSEPVGVQAPQATGQSFRPFAVFVTPFGSTLARAYGPTSVDYRKALRSSPYARAFALSQRLLARAATPYDYVMRVKSFLTRGFSYDENPPVSRYPLETFLFTSKRGYCQQFAGAMALLLRMGGVPARVSTGFTTGTRDKATHSWVVGDLDAHAWVEAWFPSYGWVRFDPTPAAAPALGGHTPLPASKPVGQTGFGPKPSSHGLGTALGAAAGVRHHRSAGTPVVPIVLLAVIVGLAAIGLRATLRTSEPTSEELLAELERALARCGRPLSEGTTLAAIERGLLSSPEAQDYVRCLRLARFAGAAERPSRRQRRALRAHLREGLGIPGLARALWALPPRITVGRRGLETSGQGINFR